MERLQGKTVKNMEDKEKGLWNNRRGGERLRICLGVHYCYLS